MAEEAAAAAEKVVEAVEEAVNGTAKVELSFKPKWNCQAWSRIVF